MVTTTLRGCKHAAAKGNGRISSFGTNVPRLTVLNHISRKCQHPFLHLPSLLVRYLPRVCSYFICFAYPAPFLRLAEISRQFTLCALRRFPPFRFRPPWRTYPSRLFRRLTLAMFLPAARQRPTRTDTRARACNTRVLVKPNDGVFVSIVEAAPSVLFCTYFALIHPSRPLIRLLPPSATEQVRFFFSRAVKQFSLSG